MSLLAVALLIVCQSGGDKASGSEPWTEDETSWTEDMLELDEAVEDELSPPLDVKKVVESFTAGRREVYQDEGFRFCHDPDYGRRGTMGTEFCPLFDEESESVCPEARRSCQQWVPHGQQGSRKRVISGSNSNRRFRLPSIPQGLAQVLTAVFIVLGLLLLVRGVAGLRSGRRRRDQGEATEEDLDLLGQVELPKSRAEVLLKEARLAVETGDLARGAALTHLSLLRYHDDTGSIRFHPSRTNGDYIRSLRSRPDSQSLFRRSARQIERLRFGDGIVEPDTLEALLAHASREVASSPSRTPNPAALGLTSTTILLALLVSSGVGCYPDTRAPAYRFRGPTGLSALPALFEEAGIPYLLSDSSVPDLLGEGVVVLRTASLPSADDDDGCGLCIDLILSSGTDVVVIDDGWSAPALFPVTATVAKAGAVERVVLSRLQDKDLCVEKVRPMLDIVASMEVLLPRARRLVPTGEPAYSGFLDREAVAEPILHPDTSTGAIALYVHGVEEEVPSGSEGSLYLFSDRDLFTNASLTRRANANAVAAMFASLLRKDEVVHLVDAVERYGTNGGQPSGAPNPGRVLQASKLLPALGQLFIFLLGLFAFLGAAFGPLVDARSMSRKRFAEHVEAIGRWYGRSGAAGRLYAARILSRWLHHQYRDRVHSGDWSGLAEELAQARGLDPIVVKEAFEIGHAGSGTQSYEDPSPEVLRALSVLTASTGAGTHRA